MAGGAEWRAGHWGRERGGGMSENLVGNDNGNGTHPIRSYTKYRQQKKKMIIPIRTYNMYAV